jgi:hypothetical protein
MRRLLAFSRLFTGLFFTSPRKRGEVKPQSSGHLSMNRPEAIRGKCETGQL